MSRPAVSCSRRYTDNASTYCSRKRLITIASRNDFRPRFSVYQLGRGNEPVMVVASSLPAVALIICLLLAWEWENDRSYHFRYGCCLSVSVGIEACRGRASSGSGG